MKPYKVGIEKSTVNTPYHNIIFVAYDKEGKPKNAFLRGTISNTDKPFKRDLDGPDKSYPFTLSGHPSSNRVFCYESSVDAISHASILKMNGEAWNYDHRISLGGTIFSGLDRFLEENPRITGIVACLDNDETGHNRSKKMMDLYTAKGYKVTRLTPRKKDFNQDLLNIVQGNETESIPFENDFTLEDHHLTGNYHFDMGDKPDDDMDYEPTY